MMVDMHGAHASSFELENETLTARPVGQPTSLPRTYMVLIASGTSSLVELPATGVRVIGRGPDADIQVEDPLVSRRHARLLLSEGQVRVEDLGSHNGTRVNGHRILGAKPLLAGDELAIGSVVLVLHNVTQTAGRQVLDREGLRLRLATEIERAAAYDRPLAVVALHVESPKANPERVAAWASTLLRGCDGLGWMGDGYLVALLPELRPEEARATALRLEEALRARVGPGVVCCGLACFPTDGGEAMVLLGAARAAATRPGEVGEARQQVTQLRLGERTLWLADATMIRLYEMLRRLAASDLPVLIQGETGTGKENAAFAVHFWSSRQGRPYVAVNCATLPESLAESELFGHEKGAFTGAVGVKKGHFENAHGGTLFLDEVGELPLAVQAKLLRALENKHIRRLGGAREVEVDVRLVAATHRDLAEEVRQGRFREDLYFRLKGAQVIVPPLRDRPRELGLLAEVFLATARRHLGREPGSVAAAALQQLRSYRWRGNVRELKNTMEFVAATLDEWVHVVEPCHLPDGVSDPRLLAEVTALASAPPPAGTEGEAATPVGTPAAPAARRFRPLAEELRDLERQRMAEALQATGGVQKRAAALLAMPLRTFVMKLKQYGLGGRPGIEVGTD
jgi:two-component system response regulator AtoC